MEELKVIELFCLVDDFANRFNDMCSQKAIAYKKKKIRNRESRMSLSEIMTIEPIAKLLILVKSPFWRQFLPRLLAYPFGYVLVGAARTGKPVLKIVAKYKALRTQKPVLLVEE